MKKSGIYVITNIINNKKYVGSSVDLNSRIRNHKRRLSVNKHENKYLQASYNKYGLESFTYNVLELTDDLQKKESFWCQKLNTHNKHSGYNLAAIERGGSISEELIQKKILGSKKISKKIYLINRSGSIVNTFTSKKGTARELNINYHNLLTCIKNKIVYKDSYLFSEKIYIDIEELYKDFNKQGVYQFTFDGQFVCKYKTVTEAVLVTGLKNVSEAFKARAKHPIIGGFIWSKTHKCPEVDLKYKINGRIIIYCYDLNGNLINEFIGRKLAANFINGTVKGIDKVLSGEQKQHRGHFFTKNKLPIIATISTINHIFAKT